MFILDDSLSYCNRRSSSRRPDNAKVLGRRLMNVFFFGCRGEVQLATNLGAASLVNFKGAVFDFCSPPSGISHNSRHLPPFSKRTDRPSASSPTSPPNRPDRRNPFKILILTRYHLTNGKYRAIVFHVRPDQSASGSLLHLSQAHLWTCQRAFQTQIAPLFSTTYNMPFLQALLFDY